MDYIHARSVSKNRLFCPLHHFVAAAVFLWLLFLLNSSRAKRRTKMAVVAAAQILPYYRRRNPTVMGKNLQKKKFCFPPMVQRRALVSPGLLLSHILRQNLPFYYHSKVSKWIVFVELPSLTPHSEHLGVRNPMFSCAGGWYWGEIIFSATILNFLPPGQSLGFTVQLWVKVCGFFF